MKQRLTQIITKKRRNTDPRVCRNFRFATNSVSFLSRFRYGNCKAIALITDADPAQPEPDPPHPIAIFHLLDDHLGGMLLFRFFLIDQMLPASRPLLMIVSFFCKENILKTYIRQRNEFIVYLMKNQGFGSSLLSNQTDERKCRE